MSLRFEIFTADLDSVVALYTRALGFPLVGEERAAPVGDVALDRDGVLIGPPTAMIRSTGSARRPPTGIELVLEVDDLAAEHNRVIASGWPIEEPWQDRPWGLTDFRILDPGALPADHEPIGRVTTPRRTAAGRLLPGDIFRPAARSRQAHRSHTRRS